MAWRSYVVKRLTFFLYSFVILLVLNFLIPRLMPGNPVSRFVNPLMSPQAQRQILEQFGLTKPLYVQFLLYLRGVFTGNFGISFLYYPTPVSTLIAQRLPWTLFLTGTATVLAALLGMALGLLAAWHRGKVDSASVFSSLVLRSTPTFWLGLVLLILFGVTLKVFPTSGYFSTSLLVSGGGVPAFVQSLLYHSFLPIVTLMAYLVGGNLLIMRASTLSTLKEDYVTTMRAFGYDDRRILYGHVLRNASLPMLTNIGIQMGYIVSGAVLVETVFSYPGMGLLVYQAVLARDYPTLQGAFFVLTVTTLVALLIVDLLYGVLDPRVRR
ncbi:peptide ABC transporter permease [Sulfodiicoccus acidiphilus]|uniref:Peptide ABC transporter permease n=1 Tax=Sulfodiicoccus acidiphilus TaxID=1670455 RepID=A0A348B5V6_9CREN|nr:ABC transporter permease [Sulfodiicoccus acidiphilus]BBD73558.1 peptide ABC transporter permease [Sulfodiicoccus acidiphilus]GGT92316.1 peptide ABC transporter permease [Sulfodiicoccus acidiphilus]